MDHATALISLAVMGLFFFMVVSALKGIIRFFRLPKLNKYLRQNPNCKTTRGPRCCHCGSSSVWRSYLGSSPGARLYVHSCKACGENLYRSSV